VKNFIQKARTIAGQKFTLLNLPFYLVPLLNRELNKVMYPGIESFARIMINLPQNQ
jgi:hypothetical protein